MVLGGVRELLGVSWGTFKLLFLRLCCQEGPRGPKRRPRGLLGSIWEGFGGVLGRIWEVKMIKKSRFWYFLDMPFDALILIVFCISGKGYPQILRVPFHQEIKKKSVKKNDEQI